MLRACNSILLRLGVVFHVMDRVSLLLLMVDYRSLLPAISIIQDIRVEIEDFSPIHLRNEKA